MEDQQAADLAQSEEPIAVAMLKFTDKADGTMSVDATHSGVFDPMYQSHACLRAVSQFLPQVCSPIGTRIDGNTGTKLAITDGDRYQAMRTLALIPDDAREAILEQLQLQGEPPTNEMQFDIFADKLVALCRGLPFVPVADADANAGANTGPDLQLIEGGKQDEPRS